MFDNLGWAVIAMTGLLRLALLPLTLPSLKTADRLKEIAPEINKLKKKYKDDKQSFAKAQMQLYQQQGINPAAGCLPQIIQLLVLVAFFRAFNTILRGNGDIVAKLNEVLYPALKLVPGTQLNTRFLYLDLTKPDVFNLGKVKLPGLFLITAVLIQFISSKKMLPSLKKTKQIASETPGEIDDVAAATQKQMVYILPFMTIFFGLAFPSGLVIYMLVFSLASLGQQLLIKKTKKESRLKK